MNIWPNSVSERNYFSIENFPDVLHNHGKRKIWEENSFYGVLGWQKNLILKHVFQSWESQSTVFGQVLIN